MENKEHGKSPKATFENDRKSGTHVHQQPYVESVDSEKSRDSAADSKNRRPSIDSQLRDPPTPPLSPSGNRPPAEELDNELIRQHGTKRDQELKNVRYVSPSGSFKMRGSISRSHTAHGLPASSRDLRDGRRGRNSQEDSKAEKFASTRRWSADGFGYGNPTRLSPIREDVSNGTDYNEFNNREYIPSTEEPLYHEQTPDRRRHIRYHEDNHRERSERFEDSRDRYERQSFRYNYDSDGNVRSHDRYYDRKEYQHDSKLDSRERQAYGEHGDQKRYSPRFFFRNDPARDRMSSPSLSYEPSPPMEHDLMRILQSENKTETIENLMKRKIEEYMEERMNSTIYEEQLKQDMLWSFKQAAMAEIEKDRLESEELKKRTLEERIKMENELREKIELENKAAAIAKEAETKRIEEISRLVQKRLELSLDEAVAMLTEKISQNFRWNRQSDTETYTEPGRPCYMPWDEAHMEAGSGRMRETSWGDSKIRSSQRFPLHHAPPFGLFPQNMARPPVGNQYRKAHVAGGMNENESQWPPAAPEPPDATDFADDDEHASDTTSSERSNINYQASPVSTFQGGFSGSSSHKHQWWKREHQESKASEAEEAEARRAVFENIPVTSPSFSRHQPQQAEDNEPKVNYAKRKRHPGLFSIKSETDNGNPILLDERGQQSAMLMTPPASSRVSSTSGRRGKAIKRLKQKPSSPHLRPLRLGVKDTAVPIDNDRSLVKIEVKSVEKVRATREAKPEGISQIEAEQVTRHTVDRVKSAKHTHKHETLGSFGGLWEYLKSEATHTPRMIYFCSALMMFIYSSTRLWESRANYLGTSS
ncbi:hypothetical protein V8C34DRAFT_316234 [Trichoderma compactum]